MYFESLPVRRPALSARAVAGKSSVLRLRGQRLRAGPQRRGRAGSAAMPTKEAIEAAVKEQGDKSESSPPLFVSPSCLRGKTLTLGF